VVGLTAVRVRWSCWEDELDQFGRVEGYEGMPRRRLAPALPNARLKPRSR